MIDEEDLFYVAVLHYQPVNSGDDDGGGRYSFFCSGGYAGGGSFSSGGSYSWDHSPSRLASGSSRSGEGSAAQTIDTTGDTHSPSSSTLIPNRSGIELLSASTSANLDGDDISSLCLAVTSSSGGQAAMYTIGSPARCLSPPHGLRLDYSAEGDFIHAFLASFGQDLDFSSMGTLPQPPSTSPVIEDVSHLLEEPVSLVRGPLNNGDEQVNGLDSETKLNSSDTFKAMSEQRAITSTVLATNHNENMEPCSTSPGLQSLDLTCTPCNEKFLNQFTLNRHEKEQHSIRERFPCPYLPCKKSELKQAFKRKAHLIRHLHTCKYRGSQGKTGIGDNVPSNALIPRNLPEKGGSREPLEAAPRKRKDSVNDNEDKLVHRGIQRLKQEHASLLDGIKTKEQELDALLQIMKAKEEELRQNIEKDRLRSETIAHCIRIQTKEEER